MSIIEGQTDATGAVLPAASSRDDKRGVGRNASLGRVERRREDSQKGYSKKESWNSTGLWRHSRQLRVGTWRILELSKTPIELDGN